MDDVVWACGPWRLFYICLSASCVSYSYKLDPTTTTRRFWKPPRRHLLSCPRVTRTLFSCLYALNLIMTTRLATTVLAFFGLGLFVVSIKLTMARSSKALHKLFCLLLLLPGWQRRGRFPEPLRRDLLRLRAMSGLDQVDHGLVKLTEARSNRPRL